MKRKLKKPLAVLLIIALVVGWYALVAGFNGKPLSKKIPLGLDIKGGVYVIMEAQTKLEGAKLKELMNQTKEVISRRVDNMGIANADVRVEGKNRLRVEMPGVKDAEDAISQIGKTAQLKFVLADGSKVIDGSDVKNASIAQSKEATGYIVQLELKSKGASAFEKGTRKALSGKVKSKIKGFDGKNVPNVAIIIYLDDKIISYPNVRQVITGGKCEISGGFNKQSAQQLAALIRGGALPAPLKEISTATQNAQIGYKAFEKSVQAGIIGIILIFLIMLFGYRLAGLIANITLAMYVLIILMLMANVGGVLTLSGIAGLILSVGMAVDANVVIFTRIKEEIISGKTTRVAVQTGFKRAMTTVIDSQITTLIAAVILYQIGTSVVKGFAWTLMVGILVGLLTAVVITQLYLDIASGSKIFSKKGFFGVKKDGTAAFALKKKFSFLKHRKVYYIISASIIILGLGFSLIRGFNFGIDFTGGTMLHVNAHKQVKIEKVQNVLKKKGLNNASVIYGGKDNSEIIIKTREALNNKSRAEVLSELEKTLGFNPKKDILAQNLFGPTIGKELKTNAVKAVLLAALGMLIYIRFRFREWKFGAAAIIGVLHDVMLVLVFYGVFGVQVNNPFIAAILTVVGYSINDTIVIFDRIRENSRFMRGGREECIDVSINQTLSRSIMTSVTTLVVMVPLFIMTGSALREFVLPLMVGVTVGCISSIFMCSPIYYEFVMARGGSKYEKKIAEAEKQRKKEGRNNLKIEAKDKNKGHKKKSRAQRKKSNNK